MRIVSAAAIGLVFLLVHAAAAQDAYESLGMGYVVDEQDRPVAGAEVRGLWLPPVGAPYGPSLVVVQTDADGKFLVPLPALDVRMIQLLVSDDTGKAAFERRGFSSPSIAKVLEPIRMELRPCFHYRVRVVNAEGNPVSGANVSGMPDFLGKYTQQTNDLGEATVAIPSYVYQDDIVAWHADIGIDYVRSDVKQKKDGKFDYDGHELIQLELFPWTRRKMRVVDLDGQGVPDCLVWVNTVQLPKPGRWQLTLGTLCSDLSNAEGLVEIPLVEDRTPHKYVFAGRPGYHCFNSYPIFHQTDSPTIVVAKTVPITGQVILPSGIPADNVPVRLEGVCPQVRGYEIETTTDSGGRFYAEVPGQSYCQVRVLADQYASKIHHRTVRLNEPVTPLTISLQAVTKVFGRLVDRRGMPIEQENIYVRHIGEDGKDTIASLPASERLPQPEGARTTLRYLFDHYRKTDENGEYELVLGPGSYHVGFGHSPDNVGQKFTITSEASLEINLQDKMRPDRVLQGRVVIAGEGNKPAAGATLSGYGEALRQIGNPFGGSALADAKCDAEGRFTMTTAVRAMTLIALSSDRTQIGLADVSNEQEEVTIELFPKVVVHGQILERSGVPLTRGTLRVSAITKSMDRVITPKKFPIAFLNGEGKFTFEELFPGEEYELLMEKLVGNRRVVTQLLRFTPKKGQAELNLAPIKLPAENK